MHRVVVVGAYNEGLTVTGGPIPAPGQTVLAHHVDRGPGGKGANQAIGLRRLGVPVSLVARLGEDEAGARAWTRLVTEGLPADGLLRSPGPTGLAVILVDGSGENAITVAPGVNANLTAPEAINWASTHDTTHIVVCQLECGVDLAIGMARWAHATGQRFVLNPAPALQLPAELLGLTYLLTPNEHELRTLATNAGASPTADTAEQARALEDLGVEHVVATLGSHGALWMHAGQARSFPSPPVQALDSTGAGDAFTAGLVAAVAEGRTMPEAIDQACRAGAFCVTRRGVIDGLPTPEDLS